MISRRPKLRRQNKIFRQQGGKIPRPDQMNINVAAWGRLLRNLNFPKSMEHKSDGHSIGNLLKKFKEGKLLIKILLAHSWSYMLARGNEH